MLEIIIKSFNNFDIIDVFIYEFGCYRLFKKMIKINVSDIEKKFILDVLSRKSDDLGYKLNEEECYHWENLWGASVFKPFGRLSFCVTQDHSVGNLELSIGTVCKKIYYDKILQAIPYLHKDIIVQFSLWLNYINNGRLCREVIFKIMGYYIDLLSDLYIISNPLIY